MLEPGTGQLVTARKAGPPLDGTAGTAPTRLSLTPLRHCLLEPTPWGGTCSLSRRCGEQDNANLSRSRPRNRSITEHAPARP